MVIKHAKIRGYWSDKVLLVEQLDRLTKELSNCDALREAPNLLVAQK